MNSEEIISVIAFLGIIFPFIYNNEAVQSFIARRAFLNRLEMSVSGFQEKLKTLRGIVFSDYDLYLFIVFSFLIFYFVTSRINYPEMVIYAVVVLFVGVFSISLGFLDFAMKRGKGRSDKRGERLYKRSIEFFGFYRALSFYAMTTLIVIVMHQDYLLGTLLTNSSLLNLLFFVSPLVYLYVMTSLVRRSFEVTAMRVLQIFQFLKQVTTDIHTKKSSFVFSGSLQAILTSGVVIRLKDDKIDYIPYSQIYNASFFYEQKKSNDSDNKEETG